MKITKEELIIEKKYLEQTLNTLKEIIDEKNESIDNKKKEVYESKKYIWDNTGVLDDVEIATSINEIDNEVNLTNLNIKKVESLSHSLSSPYFGRIDFEGDDLVTKVYIGINGIRKDLNILVFDWRTPIASLFYNYELGDAEYAAPYGKIKGEITLKRQYKVKDGKLIRCFNSNLNIDDEYLQEILASSSSEYMTNIVNTIQKEQNQIIRNLKDRYLIVQGIAGSGKTSVALHRIAFLLYNEKNLTNRNVLIFSPNEVFSKYICNVLPELGEENVLQSTFSNFASSYMKGNHETFTDYIKRYYQENNFTEGDKIKQSEEFKEQIDDYLKKYLNNGRFIVDFPIDGHIYKREELNELYLKRFKNRKINERLKNIAEYISEAEGVSQKKVFEKLQKIFNLKKKPLDIYFDLLEDNKIDLNEFTIIKNGKVKRLSYTDLIPLLYINFEYYGYPDLYDIKHVIIDEAQDYNLMQLEMLKNIFRGASFTILGDINQTINPLYKYDDLKVIENLFDNKQKYFELNKTYRSSEEIIEYTNKILDLKNVSSVRRKVEIPVDEKDIDKQLIREEIINDISKMKENNMNKIAIIAKNSDETKMLFEKLKDRYENLILIDSEVDSKISNLVVLPSYLSKGLEFDGVIAYTDKENRYNEDEKNLFYVVCTRAQHSLCVYNQKS